MGKRIEQCIVEFHRTDSGFFNVNSFLHSFYFIGQYSINQSYNKEKQQQQSILSIVNMECIIGFDEKKI